MRTELLTARGTVVCLRPARADDEGFLEELYRDRRAPEVAQLGWSHDDQLAFLRMQFRAQQEGYGGMFPDAASWIVVVGGQRAGRLLVAHEPDGHHVVDVVVLSPFRGGGIGTALMQAAVEEARRARTPVRVMVPAYDRRLIGWYERLGFSVVGERLPDVTMAWLGPG